MFTAIAQWLAALMLITVTAGAGFQIVREVRFNRRSGLRSRVWLGAAPHITTILINAVWFALLLVGGFWA